MRRMPSKRPAAGGMSLVELVIASLIVSLMLVAALNTLGSSARASVICAERCVGANLARQLLAEVVQAPYRDPSGGEDRFGPERDERVARRDWDDVDDYRHWRASPPERKDGTPLVTAAGWAREAHVDYVLPEDPTRTTGSETGLKRITVTAVSPGGKRITVSALRSDKGVYDQAPETATTYVGGVGVEIQLGGDPAARITSGTHVLNPVGVSP